MKYLGGALSAAGAVMLAVSAIGHWTTLVESETTPPREWERYDPGLATLDSPQELAEAAKARLSASPSQQELMNALHGVVADRFAHGEATHTFFSNWVLSLLGKLHPTFAHVWSPDSLAKRSALLCDQSAYLLMDLALANGVKARQVGLGGHVVMEAWYDSDWHLYDPDMEVVPADSSGRVLSVEELAVKPELLERYYGAHGLAHLISSRENNTYVSYPTGARFEWKANVFAIFESAMEILKFLLALALIGIGAWLSRRGASSTAESMSRRSG